MNACWTGIIVVTFLAYVCSGNIHRAVPGSPVFVKKTKLTNSDIIDEIDEEIEHNIDSRGRILSYIYKIKQNKAWLYSIPAAMLVGSTGIFPLLIFKVEPDHSLNEAISPSHLKLLLSFAVGGLLGDVFLHLLPEAWLYLPQGDNHSASLTIGLWVIAGLLCFLILEKIFMEEEKIKEKQEELKQQTNKQLQSTDITDEKTKYKNGLTNGHTNGYTNGHVVKNGHGNGYSNGEIKKRKHSEREKESDEYNKEDTCESDTENEESLSENQIKIVGYLNLLANCIDNFTHGLAVSGSFLVSPQVGVCTTFAILLHEIPHEIGDFAILLKAGFKRWDAAKGQLLTASGALFGCLFGLIADTAGDTSAWVLPFTSGGFIYIGMVTVVPDLLKEHNLIESLKQITALLAGVGIMTLVGTLHH